jgi:rare lipoprotein A
MIRASLRRGHPSLAALALAALVVTACAPAPGTVLPSTRGTSAPVVVPAAPRTLPGFREVGIASWYGPGFAGRRTANGEVFDPSLLTAAHRTLPFGTRLMVTNLDTGASVEVRINDRGPFKADRVIDLSRGAAERIGLVRSGVAPVRLELVNAHAGAARIAGVPRLRSYEALSLVHSPGQLLVLRSSLSDSPVLVRVVLGTFPIETNADIVVAEAVYLALGPDVDVSED